MPSATRRRFLRRAAALALGPALASCAGSIPGSAPLYRISLAPWSLMRTAAGTPDPDGIPLMDYPAVAAELGFEAVEHDNLHFPGVLPDDDAITEMRRRCDDAGLRSTLILCGQLGDLADADARARADAVDHYTAWLDAAATLGCHGIRVVCADEITIPSDEKLDYALDGVSRLTTRGAARDLDLLIENHNGYSSDPHWLVSLIEGVDHPRCGICADFANWRLRRNPDTFWPDPYEGIRILAPHTLSVSAKSTDFDAQGREANIDFTRMMRILTDAGFRGYAAVEYFGSGIGRREGTVLTRKLLERVRSELA